MEESAAVSALAALSQTSRLRVFRLLVQAGTPGATPGQIADSLQLAPATLSFHLKELTHAGLVTQERQGRHLVYRAAYEAMNELLAYLSANCCRGEPCALTAAEPARPEPACC